MSLYRINGTNGFIQLEDGVITVHRDNAGSVGLNTYRLDITKETYPLGRLPRSESAFLSVMDAPLRKGEYRNHKPENDPLSIMIPKTLADDEIIGFMQAVWKIVEKLKEEDRKLHPEKEPVSPLVEAPVVPEAPAVPGENKPGLTLTRVLPPKPAAPPKISVPSIARTPKHENRHTEEVAVIELPSILNDDLPNGEVFTVVKDAKVAVDQNAEVEQGYSKTSPSVSLPVAKKLPPVPRREAGEVGHQVSSVENNYGRQWFIDCESPYVREYVSVDIETTGLDEIDDRIIEIAAIRYIDDVEVSRFSSFVRPYTPQLMAEYTFAEFEELSGTTGINYIEDPYVTKLTGIDNHMLVDAPTADQIAPAFFDFIGNLPVVGHNFLGFDLKFLRNFANDTKTRTSIGHDVIDTMKMAEVFAKDAGSRALTNVGLFLGAPETISHRAVEDAVYTAYIYKEMKKLATPAEAEKFRFFNTDHLSHLTIVPNPDTAFNSEVFAGKNVVFTGEMKMYRGQAMQYVVDGGGRLTQGITKQTDYLVSADDNDTNEVLKLRKSFQHRQAGQDIEILQESDFYNLIGRPDYLEWRSRHEVVEDPSLEPALPL